MKSILIIEDNVGMLEGFAQYLEAEGHRVYAANKADKGIEMAYELMPDLIVCEMPGPCMDGYEVINKLIDKLGTINIPFIFCTTMSEKIIRSDVPGAGEDDCRIKTFELETILKMAGHNIKTGNKRQRLTA